MVTVVLVDIRIITTANATNAPRDITNITRVPVTAARKGTPIITTGNATSVPKGISRIPPVPVSVALRGTRIITTGSAGTGNNIDTWIAGLIVRMWRGYINQIYFSS